MKYLFQLSFVPVLCIVCTTTYTQQLTGVWSGKINKKRTEIKFVQKGDSITGTSYYFESGKNYLRYSIKGYFDGNNNSVVWWDDQLISDENNSSKEVALLSVADFNCPGDGKMQLDGTTTPKENHVTTGNLLLTKIITTGFPDEWDFVIDNYLEGTNDPDIIDSVALIAFTPKKKAKRIEEPKQIPVEVIFLTLLHLIRNLPLLSIQGRWRKASRFARKCLQQKFHCRAIPSSFAFLITYKLMVTPLPCF